MDVFPCKLITCKYQHNPVTQIIILRSSSLTLHHSPPLQPLRAFVSSSLSSRISPISWLHSSFSTRDFLASIGTSPSFRIQRTEIFLFSHVLIPAISRARVRSSPFFFHSHRLQRSDLSLRKPLRILVLRIPTSIRETVCRLDTYRPSSSSTRFERGWTETRNTFFVAFRSEATNSNVRGNSSTFVRTAFDID